MAKILVVDDEESLLQALRYNLTRAGHDVRVSMDGQQAVDLIRADAPDAVVLDIMLPGLDGLEVCRALRADTSNVKASRVPILMLSARAEEVDRIVGLELGADDYLTKPFSMRELAARVKSLLRRSDLGRPPEDMPPRLQSGDLIVDVGSHRASVGDEVLRLKPREFELLSYFMRHPGQVLTRDRLLERVWGYDFAGDTRTVDVHVRWLRSKVEREPSNPVRIQTVRGVGYMFVE